MFHYNPLKWVGHPRFGLIHLISVMSFDPLSPRHVSMVLMMCRWTSEASRTMKTFVTLSAGRGNLNAAEGSYSGGGSWDARAGCRRCRPTWSASCRPCSSCTAPCRPAPGTASRPPPPGRTPWWPSPATGARGPGSRPPGLEAQTGSQKTSAFTGMIRKEFGETGSIYMMDLQC